MHIEKIEWIDKDGKEAILKVTNDVESLKCFSCPCNYNIGDELTDPLECLDIENIVLSDTMEDSIEKMEDEFKYIFKGRLRDKQNGIIEVGGFELHIDEEKIPGDITDEMYIQFVVSRIDVW